MIRDDKVTVRFIWKDGYEREHSLGKYGCIGVRHKDNGSRPISAEWVIRPVNKEEIPEYVGEIMQCIHKDVDVVSLAIKLLVVKNDRSY